MSLSKVQQTKIRAALAWVRDKHGPEDVQHLIGMARQMTAQGAPERAAWNFAMDQLHHADPDLSEKIAQSFNLLDASDDATVTRYEGALTEYLDSGDQSALLDVRPDIARDDATLDFRNGVISKQELDARVAEIEAGNIAPAQEASTRKTGNQSFGFNAKLTNPNVNKVPARDPGSQQSLGGGPAGMVAPKAARLWAQDAAVREALAAQSEGSQTA